MLASRNSSQEGGALKWSGKVKIPKLRSYMGDKEVLNLKNFMFDMNQYFQEVGITSKEVQPNPIVFLSTNVKV